MDISAPHNFITAALGWFPWLCPIFSL